MDYLKTAFEKELTFNFSSLERLKILIRLINCNCISKFLLFCVYFLKCYTFLMNPTEKEVFLHCGNQAFNCRKKVFFFLLFVQIFSQMCRGCTSVLTSSLWRLVSWCICMAEVRCEYVTKYIHQSPCQHFFFVLPPNSQLSVIISFFAFLL